MIKFALTLLCVNFILISSSFSQTWRELLKSADSLAGVSEVEAALNKGQSALDLAIEQFGPKDSSVATIERRIGVYWYYLGNYVEATTHIQNCLNIRKEIFGPNHTEVGIALRTLATMMEMQSRYPEAEEMYKEALAIFKSNPDVKPVEIAALYDNIGILYFYSGRLDEAEDAYNRAIKIKTEIDSTSTDLALSLNNLSELYRLKGMYYEADLILRRALTCFENELGTDHPTVADALDVLALLNIDLRKFVEAEKLSRRALTIREEKQVTNHPELINTLDALALALTNLQKYDEAESIYLRSLEIAINTFGENNEAVGRGMNNLANLYSEINEFNKALDYHFRALSIKKNIYPANHPSTAYSMLNIGNILLFKGNVDSAQTLFEHSMEMLKKTYGYQHKDIADMNENICKLRRVQKKYDEAIKAARDAFEIQRNHFFDNNIALSEKESQAFYKDVRTSAANYLSCVVDFGLPTYASVSEAAEVILSTKGEISDDLFLRQRNLFANADQKVTSLLDTLRNIRSEFAQLYVVEPDVDISLYKNYIDSLSIEADRINVKLSNLNVQYQIEEKVKKVTAENLSELLPDHSALVEYYNYEYQQLSPMRLISRYMVLIIKKNQQPIILDLGEADKIDSLVYEIRRHINWVARFRPVVNQNDFDEYSSLANELYTNVWKPVYEQLSNDDIILIAPDGALNSISFGTLIDNKNNFMIQTNSIHYLSSGRDLLRYQGDIVSSKGLLALGDPDYNKIAESKVTSKNESSSYMRSLTSNGLRSPCGQFDDLFAEPLPWTRKEVITIAEWWKSGSTEPVKILTGVNASEEQLKAELVNNRIIHLATHGFYLNSDCTQSNDNITNNFSEMYVRENPLLMSGLLLAGANRHNTIETDKSIEDGILTAYEVASMNLTGVDKVVLSACESGLGEIQQGEGVYGLRRAFLMSGARLVVSALWQVPDELTSKLMLQLYNDIELPAYQRLRNAQLKLINEMKIANKPAHPFTWGGFVTTGDWR